MQDNYPNIDKKFTDKGWAAMRDLLDEEMPTAPKKRKRRGLIFLLLFLGIAVGIAIGVAASGLYLNEKTPQQSGNTIVLPIAKGEDISENEKGAIAKVENELSNNDISNQPNLAKKTVTKKVADAKTATQNIAANNHFKNAKKGIIENEQIPNNPFNKSITNPENSLVLTDKTESQIVENFSQNEQTVDNNEAKNVDLLSINPLNTNQLNIFEIPLTLPDFQINLPVLVEKKADNKELKNELRKGRLGITLDLQGANNFAGIAGGVVYAKPIHDKWSLQIGTNYAYQRRQFEGEPISVSQGAGAGLPNPNTVDLHDDYFEGVYNTAEAQADSVIFTIPQNLSTHYLQIPLQINYQISKKWSIGTGISGSLLLFANNDYTDGGLFNKSSVSLFREENISTVESDQLRTINKADLRNYDVAATIGIGFHPSAKWGITANYHHGFTNLFKYSSDKEYNRFFNLGIQYYFGK